VLTPAHRTYGYIWGVYVEEGWRCRGIARRLTEAVIEHLKGIGCTRVLLHSSPHGRTVYDKMGFAPTNEMGLALR
jgi:predicted GNAT family acetyltransferase